MTGCKLTLGIKYPDSEWISADLNLDRDIDWDTPEQLKLLMEVMTIGLLGKIDKKTGSKKQDWFSGLADAEETSDNPSDVS